MRSAHVLSINNVGLGDRGLPDASVAYPRIARD